MKIMLDISAEELERIVSLRNRSRVEKYGWESMGHVGEYAQGSLLPYEIHEYGESGGGLVAGFMQEEDAELVVALYSALRCSILEDSER